MLLFIANREEYNVYLGIKIFNPLCKGQSVNTGKLNFADQNVTSVFPGKIHGLLRIGKGTDGGLRQQLMDVYRKSLEHNGVIVHTNNRHLFSSVFNLSCSL